MIGAYDLDRPSPSVGTRQTAWCAFQCFSGPFSDIEDRLPGSHFRLWKVEKSPGAKTRLVKRNSLDISKAEIDISKAEIHVGMS